MLLATGILFCHVVCRLDGWADGLAAAGLVGVTRCHFPRGRAASSNTSSHTTARHHLRLASIQIVSVQHSNCVTTAGNFHSNLCVSLCIPMRTNVGQVRTAEDITSLLQSECLYHHPITLLCGNAPKNLLPQM